MTERLKQKKIRALFGLTKMPDGTIRPLLESSLKGLTDNVTTFPKPPIDLPTYKNAIGAYEAAIPAAQDGSKTAIAQKNKLRDAAVKMYTELAHYVEAHCNDDVATFLLSGFKPASTAKTPPQPLAQPTITAVVEGPLTGSLKVKFRAVPKAVSYELRHAPVPSGGGTPGSWTQVALPSSKPAIIGNLTPGTLYTFQVRALGRLGQTNWSDAVNRIAI